MLLFLFALFISCTIARPDSSRVVGGLPASEGQFKYLAQLKYHVVGFDQGAYTGSIISDQWILTNAILPMFIKPEELTVVVGTTKIADDSGWAYDVSEIISHPNFTFETDINNNIALVKVKGHIMLGGNVATISLSSTTGIPSHLSFSYAAWGTVNASSEEQNSATLQHITLTTIGMTECRKFVPKNRLDFDEEKHFCTAPLGGNGPCDLDIGAPLVYGDYQIGLDVTSMSCMNNGLPTVFLKIGVYRDWIMEVTGGLN